MTELPPELSPEPDKSPKPFPEVRLDQPSANQAIRDMNGTKKGTDKPSTVEWYRSNGQVVRESNEAIRTIPFDPRAGVDPERQQQLDLLATTMLASHNHDGVNFRDFGDILNSIAKRTDLTEREKANVWDKVVDDVEHHKVEWRNEGANPFALNINRTWRIAHELATFDDPYNAKVTNESQADANSTLTWHNLASSYEDFLWRVGPSAHSNVTNEISSRYQRECYQDLLKNGFGAFADTWNAYFISHLSPERNAYYADQIKANTKSYQLPIADRNKIQALQEQYFQENRTTAPPAIRVPNAVRIND